MTTPLRFTTSLVLSFTLLVASIPPAAAWWPPCLSEAVAWNTAEAEYKTAVDTYLARRQSLRQAVDYQLSLPAPSVLDMSTFRTREANLTAAKRLTEIAAAQFKAADAATFAKATPAYNAKIAFMKCREDNK